MTIIGEGGFDPRRWTQNPTATLQAPDGVPCITVAQGVRLELRDIVLASPNGGDAACVVGYGADIVMSRVGFRHVGDEAAIYADGGSVELRDTVIDAQTVAPAIVMDGATLNAWETVVTGAQSGIDITPGTGEPSRIDSVTLSGVETPNNFGPRAATTAGSRSPTAASAATAKASRSKGLRCRSKALASAAPTRGWCFTTASSPCWTAGSAPAPSAWRPFPAGRW
jgi:hypothetical protein